MDQATGVPMGATTLTTLVWLPTTTATATPPAKQQSQAAAASKNACQLPFALGMRIALPRWKLLQQVHRQGRAGEIRIAEKMMDLMEMRVL